MKVYTVIEMEGHELMGLATFGNESEAFDRFDLWCQDGAQIITDKDELESEVPGTIALAGDEVQSVQIVESEVT